MTNSEDLAKFAWYAKANVDRDLYNAIARKLQGKPFWSKCHLFDSLIVDKKLRGELLKELDEYRAKPRKSQEDRYREYQEVMRKKRMEWGKIE